MSLFAEGALQTPQVDAMVHPQLPLDLDPGQSLTFAAFWTGNNALLVEVLLQLATGNSQDSQIYIHGDPGCGKTHLLSATCQVATEHGYRIAYLPANIISQSTGLAGYEHYDLVCIDDLQLLGHGADCELAMFGLINGLRNTGGRLLLSAEYAGAALDIQLPDLRTRLGWGASYAIAPVPEEQLGEALAMRADFLGISLPVEVIEFLLVRHARNFESMLALLDQLKLASLRAKRKITIPFVREVLT